MARKKTFDIKGKAYAVLKNQPNQPHTSREIAERIYSQFHDECQDKLLRSDSITDRDSLIQQIARENGAHWRALVKKYPAIRTVETRPRTFYFSTRSEEDEANEESSIIKDASQQDASVTKIYKEHDLYPILGDYIYQEMNCVSMRINESRSSNKHGKGGNHWLFPDVVGMIDLSKDWHNEVSDLAESLSAKRVRLCSFEVKKIVNRSNVREVVFQTVSNSSWANHAYLVAAKLDSKATDELRLLCIAHGIGFIILDMHDPSESQILIPSTFNDKVNYDSLNRLVVENKDAEEFLENVSTFLKTNKMREKDWDLVPVENRS